MRMTANYPDISDLLQRKAAGRRAAARLSFGEKVMLVERLRTNLAPFKQAREAGIAARAARTAPASSTEHRAPSSG